MFYLDTRIHLNEVWIMICVNQEFQSTGIAIAYIFSKTDRTVEDDLSCSFRNGKSRSVFYNLLMTALYGTVTVIQVYDIAIIISKNLNFDMFRTAQIFLNEDLVIAECFF